jgi:addiction module HigA family antidote
MPIELVQIFCRNSILFVNSSADLLHHVSAEEIGVDLESRSRADDPGGTDGDARNAVSFPARPGEILKEMYMAPLGVTITQTADALGVSRKHVSGIVNGRVPVSPDMAARLAGVFGTEPDIWINLQAQYDLWQVRQHGRPKVRRLAA